MDTKKIKVTLAVCTNRGIKPQTLQSLLDMVARTADVDFHVLVATRGYTIAENRNYVVVQAQRNQSDYLLFVDDDMIFPYYTLTQLLSHKKDIVGVNSYSRCLPLSSTVGLMDENGGYKHPDKYPEWETRVPEKLFKCYFVGMGVGLIDMNVFKKMKKPYFRFETYKTGELKGMVENGEDGTFCRDAQKAGFGVWCDGTLPIGHIGDYVFEKPEENGIITPQ